MPVNDTHPKYDALKDDWAKCRDAADGQRAIHNAGEKYLPRLSGQTDSEYKAYKERGLFIEATGRTIDGLSGMLFRKPMKVEANGQDDIIGDIDLNGHTVSDFAEIIAVEILKTGRVGLLADFPAIDNPDQITQAQAEANNLRPFVTLYPTEAIINWEYGRVNNRHQLVKVFLSETVYQDDPEDEFSKIAIEQIRLLELDEAGEYKQRLFQRRKNILDKNEFELVDEIFPILGGSRLNYIPFEFVMPGSTLECPPLMGLVNANISHYRTTADLEHGAHFTALPTAVISGIDDQSRKSGDFRIGSQTAWAFINPDTKAYFLEFEGKGLDSLEVRCDKKEKIMAALGAQMLTPDARRNEAAETAQLRHSGEQSVLSAISQQIERSINKVLEWFADWTGTEAAVVTLMRDFNPQGMSPQMLTALVGAMQTGAISKQTFFENLKAGEIIAPEREFDEEQADIETQPPPAI